MIQFFRKIRQNLLSEGKTGKYLKYALGEILLVVIGILIALQLNNTKENWQKEKLRQELFIELRTSMAEDTSFLNVEKKRLKSAYISAMRLKQAIKEDLPYTESLDTSLAHILHARIMEANYRIYDRLLAIGMEIIGDQDLSNEIVHYYTDSKVLEKSGEQAQKLLVEQIYPHYFVSFDPDKAVPDDFEKLKQSNELKIVLDYTSLTSYNLIRRSVHRKNLATAILKILETKITHQDQLHKEPYIRTMTKDSIDIAHEIEQLDIELEKLQNDH